MPTATPSEMVRQWRKDKGYSLREMGQMAGIGSASINRYERGVNAISVRNAKKLAAVMRCSWKRLLED